MSRALRAAPGLALGTLVLLLLTGCGAADPTSPDATAPASGPSGSNASGGPVPGPAAGGAAAPSTPTTPRRLQPASIAVPSIGVAATMTDLGIARDGVIEVPDNGEQAGWLDTTPTPGQQGPAVIAGHVDTDTGPAVFAQLGSLQVGAAITVTRRDGSTVRFHVDGVRTYPQDRFPTAAVYGPVPGPVLRLITCGGDYVESAGGYQDNVVVYAS